MNSSHRLCDKFLPKEPIYSENNTLNIHFYSDNIFRLDGFFASFKFIKKCTNVVLAHRHSSVLCSLCSLSAASVTSLSHDFSRR